MPITAERGADARTRGRHGGKHACTAPRLKDRQGSGDEKNQKQGCATVSCSYSGKYSLRRLDRVPRAPAAFPLAQQVEWQCIPCSKAYGAAHCCQDASPAEGQDWQRREPSVGMLKGRHGHATQVPKGIRPLQPKGLVGQFLDQGPWSVTTAISALPSATQHCGIHSP